MYLQPDFDDDDEEVLNEMDEAENGGAENPTSSESLPSTSNASQTVGTPHQPQGTPKSYLGSTPMDTGITTLPNVRTSILVGYITNNQQEFYVFNVNEMLIF